MLIRENCQQYKYSVSVDLSGYKGQEPSGCVMIPSPLKVGMDKITSPFSPAQVQERSLFFPVPSWTSECFHSVRFRRALSLNKNSSVLKQGNIFTDGGVGLAFWKIKMRQLVSFFPYKAIPIKCFVSHRPPSREDGSVGRAKKRERSLEGVWVPGKAGLLSTKAWLRGPFVRNQMV